MSDTERNNKMEALTHFKDWSNYLLVTTVASLGWASTREADLPPWAFILSVSFLAVSVVFAIFTLALIPHLAEGIDSKDSIYKVESTTKPFLVFEIKSTIKWVCWPQHSAFILGIAFYTAGSIACMLPVGQPCSNCILN